MLMVIGSSMFGFTIRWPCELVVRRAVENEVAWQLSHIEGSLDVVFGHLAWMRGVLDHI